MRCDLVGGTGSTISYADFACALVDELERAAHVGQVVEAGD